jgi:hypothetical protein
MLLLLLLVTVSITYTEETKNILGKVLTPVAEKELLKVTSLPTLNKVKVTTEELLDGLTITQISLLRLNLIHQTTSDYMICPGTLQNG